MCADAQMTADESPIGIGYECQQGMDVGIAQPGALLAARTVDEGVGGAQIQCPCADTPDFVQAKIVAFKPATALTRIASFDCTDRFDPRLVAGNRREVSESHRF